jgi:hypothetical protein
MLKGKQGETKVFKPVSGDRHSVDAEFSLSVEIVGRELEMELLQRAIGNSRGGASPLSISVVGIEGVEGVGKSAILDSLTRTSMRYGGQRMLMRGSEDLSTPFMACRDILRWMLQQDSEPEADTLSWLLVCVLLVMGSGQCACNEVATASAHFF